MDAHNDTYFNEFTLPVRRIGKVSLALAMLFSFLPAIYIAVIYDAMPTFAQIMGGYVLILSTELSYYFVEPISYFPVLGEAGTYMSFLAGSIGGVRVPAVAASQDAVGVEAGSRKAELVSSIAVGSSVICSMTMGFIAIMLGNVIFALVPPFVQSMFNYVMPAVFAPLFVMRFHGNVLVGLVSLAAAALLLFSGILPSYLNMLTTVIVTVAFGVWLCKRRMS